MEIHIFDIDHTLIKKSTTFCFFRTAIKDKLVAPSHLLKFPLKGLLYKLSIIEQEFIEKEAAKFRDIPRTLLEEISRKSFELHGKKHLFSDGIELLKELKNNGHRIIAASSSLDLFIKPVTEYLGIEEWVATRLEFSEGKTTGKTNGNAVFGKNKLNAVESYFTKKKLSLSQAVFYSDSYNDLPLLDACRKAVPVNPDRRLKREAEKRGWSCLSFNRTLGG